VTVARLRFFGAAVDAAGSREGDIDGNTVDEVLTAACARYGDRFAPGDPVMAWDELAVLPPVSGG